MNMTNQQNNDDDKREKSNNKIISNHLNPNSNHWWKVCWFYDQQHQRYSNGTKLINSLKQQNRKYFTLPNRRLRQSSTTSKSTQMHNIEDKW